MAVAARLGVSEKAPERGMSILLTHPVQIEPRVNLAAAACDPFRFAMVERRGWRRRGLPVLCRLRGDILRRRSRGRRSSGRKNRGNAGWGGRRSFVRALRAQTLQGRVVARDLRPQFRLLLGEN